MLILVLICFLSFSYDTLATGRALGNRFSKVKSQEFTYRSHLDEINEIASRMNSLRNQYQSQVQDVQRLIEKAYLDLDQSKAKIESAASIFPCLIFLASRLHEIWKA